jgi:hypothetical protein
MLDREGLGVVDAEPFAPLLARGSVGELEEKGRGAGRDDADKKAGAFAVVNTDSLINTFFAYAVGQDDAAIAGALGGWFNGGRHGFQLSECLGPSQYLAKRTETPCLRLAQKRLI